MTSPSNSNELVSTASINRRNFFRYTSVAAALAAVPHWRAIAGPFESDAQNIIPADKKLDAAWIKSLYERGEPTIFRGAELEKIGMPVGGICAGQLYLGGDGRLWHWDLFNLPQPRNFSDTGGPNYAKPPKPESPIDHGFAIKVTVGGKSSIRTLDGNGFKPEHIGFRGEYPIGTVQYRDPALPVAVTLEAFSPFIPLNVPDSSLPATILSYKISNTSSVAVEVELAGWLQNAVCLGTRGGRGLRRNHVVRESRMLMAHASAERLPAAQTAAPRSDIVFETFEDGYGKWVPGGDAFGPAPARGTLKNQQNVSGFTGKALVNTFLNGDASKGKLTSPEFKVDRRYVAFQIGGGGQARRTCMNLLVDGRSVRTATGRNDEHLDPQEWDVSEFNGKTARLEIVDDSTEAWGHVNVDQIVFTDTPPSSRTPLEEREDFGSMGLALLEPDGAGFAHARSSALADESLFANAREDATAPFEEKLSASVGKKLKLAPGTSRTVTFVLAWYFPGLMKRTLGPLNELASLKRSYASRFKSAAEVARYIAKNHERLAGQTRLWRDTWYDSTLPYWFLDRTFAPICTLATNTCYQFNNGRFYAFEGVYCCQGTCQHVWNYAQSVARIFPELERDLRERTDFGTAWHADGAIDYRGECARHVAHDGQCGVILRAWREHQMAPNDKYLRATWPRIRKSVEYLIGADKDENGLIEGEQYNTLDAAWFGPMAWISSFYIAALRAGEAMALEIGDNEFAQQCRRIAESGSTALVSQLYNGEYFIHKPDPAHPKSTNTNDGCHIDQLMGQAWAMQVALPRVIAEKECKSALQAIWKYNFTPDVGPYRDKSKIRGGRWYAMPGEGGVVMTTFPRGGIEKASGEGHFAYYFNEVWTGQEHQLAAHMLWEGMPDEALIITRMVHDRHHAARRNPYNEVECSDHYTRAMSSHGTFIAACGYEYHGPKGHLAFAPKISPDKFKAPFTAAEGWGTVEQTRIAGALSNSVAVRYGQLRLRTLALAPSEGHLPTKAQVKANGRDIAATLQRSGDKWTVTLAREITVKAGEALEVKLT